MTTLVVPAAAAAAAAAAKGSDVGPCVMATVHVFRTLQSLGPAERPLTERPCVRAPRKALQKSLTKAFLPKPKINIEDQSLARDQS